MFGPRRIGMNEHEKWVQKQSRRDTLHKAGSISLAGAAIMLGTSCESAPSLIPFPPVHKQHHQKSLKLALDAVGVADTAFLKKMNIFIE